MFFLTSQTPKSGLTQLLHQATARADCTHSRLSRSSITRRPSHIQRGLAVTHDEILVREHDVVDRRQVREVADHIVRGRLGHQLRQSREQVLEYFAKAG